MACSFSNHVNNLSEGIHRIKYKFRHNDKKGQTVFFNIKTLKII